MIRGCKTTRQIGLTSDCMMVFKSLILTGEVWRIPSAFSGGFRKCFWRDARKRIRWRSPFTGWADPQLSTHGLHSHFQKSSEACQHWFRQPCSSTGPLQTLPSNCWWATHTDTHTNYESKALLLQRADSSPKHYVRIQFLVISGLMDSKLPPV